MNVTDAHPQEVPSRVLGEGDTLDGIKGIDPRTEGGTRGPRGDEECSEAQ